MGRRLAVDRRGGHGVNPELKAPLPSACRRNHLASRVGSANRPRPQPLVSAMNPRIALFCVASLAGAAEMPSPEWQIKTAVLAAPKAERAAAG